MTIEIDPREDWEAAAAGALKALVKRLPGIAEALGAYEEFDRGRKRRALQQLIEDMHARLDRFPRVDAEWLSSEDGQMFTGKTIDAALSLQTADKRELFANALLNGAARDLPFAMKMKFVDLLRDLSRAALDVLAHLHREFGPKVGNPSESKFISPERVAEQLCSGSTLDPYAVVSAVEELRAAGLFSHVTRWARRADGAISSSSSYSAGNIAYTEFTESFVRFITEPPT